MMCRSVKVYYVIDNELLTCDVSSILINLKSK